MPTKLYIGNVPQAINPTELKELFEKYGKVLECDIIKDYAFHMEDSSKAKASIAALNDFNLKGNRIRVELSTTQLRNGSRSSRREDSPRRHSSSTSSRSSRREYPTTSSSRSGGYSSGGGGGPDRSYPSMRSSYMDARSRPYDSPFERQRMPPPPPPMSYGDPYSMRNGPVDMYGRDDPYQHRGAPMSMSDHYGRGPSMRSSYDAYPAYSSGSSSMGSSRSRYASSPPPSSSRNGSDRYESSSRSSSSRRTSRRSPPPPSSSSSSRSRR
ncbi:unnamed protein product [Adineta ricciae]|uniref:RRM domain-containing protein n=1 Tax=Adineta ricciae TaxID=249248 RepID=A0A814RG58_ADIRI|nr:unnamed protein product [Adineta ricciae]